MGNKTHIHTPMHTHTYTIHMHANTYTQRHMHFRVENWVGSLGQPGHILSRSNGYDSVYINYKILGSDSALDNMH